MKSAPYESSECLKGYHAECGVKACQCSCHGDIPETELDLDESDHAGLEDEETEAYDDDL